jgi:hypothetical protein
MQQPLVVCDDWVTFQNHFRLCVYQPGGAHLTLTLVVLPTD